LTLSPAITKRCRLQLTPVAYLTAYREGLIADGFEDGEICQQAIAEIAELEDIIRNENIGVKDARVREMLAAEYGSETWVMQTFGMLKLAGFTREQAIAWALIDDGELTKAERFKERTIRYFIDAVYSER